MKIRFQADADLRVPIIKGLKRREPTIDFATAPEAGLTGLDDRAVLELAASQNRVLVSHDVSTMPEAFSNFIQKRSSPGVILVSQELLIVRRSRDYLEFGQTLKQKTGKTFYPSCRDRKARKTIRERKSTVPIWKKDVFEDGEVGWSQNRLR